MAALPNQCSNYTRVRALAYEQTVPLVAESAEHFRRVPAPWAGTS
jgi:hypothetical protein